MHICNPSTREEKTRGSVGLSYQSSLFSKLQASEMPYLKKTKWVALRNANQRWPLTSTYTQAQAHPYIYTHQEKLQCLEHPQRTAFSNSDISAKTCPLRRTWASILLLFGLFFSTGIEPRASLCHWVHSYPATRLYLVVFQFHRNHNAQNHQHLQSLFFFSTDTPESISSEREIQVT